LVEAELRLDEILVIAPLVAVDIVEGGGILEAGRFHPVQGKSQSAPRCDRREFFLTDIVVEPAAVAPDTAAQH
jgi:hypothetical protein